VIVGDSLGNIKTYLFNLKEKTIDKYLDTMGNHNSMITAITYDEERVYTFGMDNKFNVWSRS
jgi:hypothetical protein